MTDTTPSRWRFVILPLVLLSITLPRLIRDRVVIAQAWPVWRLVVLDLLLVLAGAVAVAGIAFGVHAWYQAKRDTLA